MNISQLVKKNLPNYIFNGASNRSCKEINKLCMLTTKNKLFLIYIKRNQMTEKVFLKNQTNKIINIVEMFLYDGYTYLVEDGHQISEHNLTSLLLLKKTLLGSLDCVVCYTKFNDAIYVSFPVACCGVCSAIHCLSCVNEMIDNDDETFKCSICRHVKNIKELGY